MKTSKITLLIAVAILIGSFMLWNQQHHKAKLMESRLQDTLGSAMYQIWSNYNEITQYPLEELTWNAWIS